jgi:hypothetical protein
MEINNNTYINLKTTVKFKTKQHKNKVPREIGVGVRHPATPQETKAKVYIIVIPLE